MFPQNEGGLDRIIRFIIGAILGVGVFTFLGGSLVLQIIGGVLAVILLVTAVIGFCPLYFPFHINTRSSKK